jgi:integrase
MQLTDRYIRGIKASELTRRKEIADQSLRDNKPRKGLVLLASPTGNHAWFYQRMLKGTRHKRQLGTYPELTLADARELVDDINDHDDGPEAAMDKLLGPNEPEASVLTVQRLINRYMDEECSQNRGWEYQKQTLERELADYLHLPANELTTDHVKAIMQDCLNRKAPRTAQEILKQIKGLYNWALGTKRVRKTLQKKEDVSIVQVRTKIKEISHNPTEGIVPPRYETESFHFEGKALKAFLPKLKASDVRDDAKLILKIQYQTFCRVGEVAGMRWDELDLKKRRWVIPGERYKNGRPHTVCLSKQTAAILKELPRESETYVFKQPRNDQPINSRDVAKAINKRRDSLNMDSRFKSHVLRHSGATWLAAQHCPVDVRERLLGHVVDDPTDMAQRYQHHDFWKERTKWTQQWCDYLEGK